MITNESTLATISERGQMILPAHIRKALGLSANAQVAVRIVKRGDHFIAEIEVASLAARSRNASAAELGKKLVQKMAKKYGNNPQRDAIADERGEE